ncbi:MAG: AraC family transcriptional regulator [Robiginitomaculum sp.]|nr:AraC family transcriptional regulator [Robiginitomaculum sp.]
MSEQRYPIDLIFKILDFAEKTLGKPDIGLLCGTNLRPASLNELGSAIMCCGTLRQVIMLNRRYQILTQQLGRTNLKTNGDQAHLIWEPHYKDAEYGRMVTDVVMAGHAIFGRWLSWVHDKKINAVHFKHARPSYAYKYIEIFDCPVSFGQDENAMLIDVEAIDAPLPQANEKSLAEICQRLDVALANLQPAKPMAEQVSDMLYTEMSNAVPNLEQTARQLGVSPRSLRRSLQAEQTNFRLVLEQTRRTLCAKMMADNIALLSIADRLGYSQQSAFNRAFKQWFGATPKAYVRAQKDANAAFDQLAP